MTRTPGLRGRLPQRNPGVRYPINYAHQYAHPLSPLLTPPAYPIDVTAGLTDWHMLGNGPDPELTDHPPVGDCVWAGRQHYKMVKAANAGLTEQWETVNDLVAEYLAYNHGQDQGANIADALLTWYRAGKIEGFAPVELQSRTLADACLVAFHGLLCGVQLTPDAGELFGEGKSWTVGGGQQPDPAEGHCVVQVGTTGSVDGFVTWGAVQEATVEWTAVCRDEAWVVVTSEDASIAGVDLGQLRADIDALGGTR